LRALRYAGSISLPTRVNKCYYNDTTPSATTYSPVVFLSGDVHPGEVSGQPGYLEITSSGLTHHCGEPKLYGRLCQPLLENFNQHRYEPNSFYVGLNYGMLHVDWEARNIQVQVKDASGGTVLQVQQCLDDVKMSNRNKEYLSYVHVPRYPGMVRTKVYSTGTLLTSESSVIRTSVRSLLVRGAYRC
jgi:hypothetical protein